MNKKILKNFNKFINSHGVDPIEVCIFIYSLLIENGYKNYYPTELFGEEDVLMDK